MQRNNTLKNVVLLGRKNIQRKGHGRRVQKGKEGLVLDFNFNPVPVS